MSSVKHVPSSKPAAPGIDRLSALLSRFRVRTHLFFSGSLCGLTPFEAQPGRAFLHVLRAGTLEVSHPQRLQGLPRRLRVSEPMLLFYPRAVTHRFHNPPREGSAFSCATLDFEGGAHNPLVAALPPLIALPLREADGLQATLDVLFAETDRVRCGSRLLADRLFEVVLIQLLRWLLDHPAQAGIRSGLILGLADPHLARALVAVHAEPGAAWTLPRLAEAAALSRTTFAARFRQTVGTTPMDYVADWRITLACAGLREGRAVKALAAELGYGSAAALSKAFKQRQGVAPRAWPAREAPA
ncbi:MAG: AraC family transcriptional regulator [Proteobacteria bacterium]|nr:AraC family transcriptional regulator [Pseudomonadota bacterium]